MPRTYIILKHWVERAKYYALCGLRLRFRCVRLMDACLVSMGCGCNFCRISDVYIQVFFQSLILILINRCGNYVRSDTGVKNESSFCYGIETWNWKEFSKKLSRISQIKSSNLTSLVSFIFSVENSFVLYYKIVHYETSRECFNIVREKKRRCENFILDDEEFLRVFH